MTLVSCSSSTTVHFRLHVRPPSVERRALSRAGEASQPLPAW